MKVSKMFKSFRFAFLGIVHLIKGENNARFHLLASLIALFLGLYFKIDKTEWIIVIFAIVMVWSAEAFNSAVEKLCDKIELKHDDAIGKIKDLAASGVLFVAIGAAVAGLIIFIPKIFKI